MRSLTLRGAAYQLCMSCTHLLQALGRGMSCTEVAALRQVSKQWQHVFGQQVPNVILPQQTWQHPQAGDAAPPGTDVLLVFPSVRKVQLSLDPMQPLSAPKLHGGFQRLAQVPTLRHLVLECFTQPQHWEQVARSLPLLGQQLTALTLAGATWPGRDQLAALQRLPRLQALDITCPHLSRLEQPHLEVRCRWRDVHAWQCHCRTAWDHQWGWRGFVGSAKCEICLQGGANALCVHHPGLCTAACCSGSWYLRCTCCQLTLPTCCTISLDPVQVIAGIVRLRRLRLAFRIVAGTAHTPLCLSPLSALSGLEELTLEFMGEFMGEHETCSSSHHCPNGA